MRDVSTSAAMVDINAALTIFNTSQQPYKIVLGILAALILCVLALTIFKLDSGDKRLPRLK